MWLLRLVCKDNHVDTSKNLDDGTNMRSSVRTGQIRIVNKPESSGLAPRRLEPVQGFLEVSMFVRRQYLHIPHRRLPQAYARFAWSFR